MRMAIEETVVRVCYHLTVSAKPGTRMDTPLITVLAHENNLEGRQPSTVASAAVLEREFNEVGCPICRVDCKEIGDEAGVLSCYGMSIGVICVEESHNARGKDCPRCRSKPKPYRVEEHVWEVEDEDMVVLA